MRDTWIWIAEKHIPSGAVESIIWRRKAFTLYHKQGEAGGFNTECRLVQHWLAFWLGVVEHSMHGIAGHNFVKCTHKFREFRSGLCSKGCFANVD
jgi:hypothetical protein